MASAVARPAIERNQPVGVAVHDEGRDLQLAERLHPRGRRAHRLRLAGPALRIEAAVEGGMGVGGDALDVERGRAAPRSQSGEVALGRLLAVGRRRAVNAAITSGSRRQGRGPGPTSPT